LAPWSSTPSPVVRARGSGIFCNPVAVNIFTLGCTAEGATWLTPVRRVRRMRDSSDVHELNLCQAFLFRILRFRQWGYQRAVRSFCTLQHSKVMGMEMGSRGWINDDYVGAVPKSNGWRSVRSRCHCNRL
jgi:hypothetical protein